MIFLKEAVRKLFTGFLYGAGFTLGMWVIAFFVAGKLNLPEGTKGTISEGESARPENKAKNIEVLSSKAIARPYLIDVIGTLKNNGNNPVSHTELVADLYSKDGEFIYQCQTWLSDAIPPNGQVNFKISCHGITEDIYQGYSSYKLKVGR